MPGGGGLTAAPTGNIPMGGGPLAIGIYGLTIPIGGPDKPGGAIIGGTTYIPLPIGCALPGPA
jgi:hypothetical protein